MHALLLLLICLYALGAVFAETDSSTYRHYRRDEDIVWTDAHGHNSHECPQGFNDRRQAHYIWFVPGGKHYNHVTHVYIGEEVPTCETVGGMPVREGMSMKTVECRMEVLPEPEPAANVTEKGGERAVGDWKGWFEMQSMS